MLNSFQWFSSAIETATDLNLLSTGSFATHSENPPKTLLQADPDPNRAKADISDSFALFDLKLNKTDIAFTKTAMLLAEEAHPAAVGKVFLLIMRKEPLLSFSLGISIFLVFAEF
jgi:hypothetical protein